MSTIIALEPVGRETSKQMKSGAERALISVSGFGYLRIRHEGRKDHECALNVNKAGYGGVSSRDIQYLSNPSCSDDQMR
jgi:hypothetical protein